MKVTIRTKELKDGNRSIYLDVYDKGTRKYEYLRLYLVPEVDNKAKRQNENAMKRANEIKAEYILGTSDLLKPKAEPKDEMTLQSWLDEYYRRVRDERGVSKGTVRHAKHIKAIIEGFLSQAHKENIRIADFGRGEMAGLLRYLGEYKGSTGKQYSPCTLWVCQKRIVTVFNSALHEGLITVNPKDRLNKSEVYGEVESSKQPLTIEEVERIAAVDTKHPAIRDAFVFACLTGLRISDICTLKWDEIHDIAGRPTIVKKQVKTGNVVSVPICDTALRYMPARECDERVFHLPSMRTLQERIPKIAEAAGIQKHVTFHTSRHTFATLALAADGEIKTVSSMLGHKSVKTTAIYADVGLESKAKAINGLSAIFQNGE